MNGKWSERTRNEKCFTCLQDKSTTLKLIPMLNPKQLLFSSNLLLKIIQENTLFLEFLFLTFFFFSFFFLEELYSFFLFLIFFSLNKYNKINTPPHLPYGIYHTNPKHKNIRSHYHRLANINKTRVRWCGWTKETANECLVQKGILKFVFRWMVNILAMVLN